MPGGVANRSIPSSVEIDLFATILGMDAAHMKHFCAARSASQI